MGTAGGVGEGSARGTKMTDRRCLPSAPSPVGGIEGAPEPIDLEGASAPPGDSRASKNEVGEEPPAALKRPQASSSTGGRRGRRGHVDLAGKQRGDGAPVERRRGGDAGGSESVGASLGDQR